MNFFSLLRNVLTPDSTQEAFLTTTLARNVEYFSNVVLKNMPDIVPFVVLELALVQFTGRVNVVIKKTQQKLKW